LYDIVKSVNPHIHFIEEVLELQPEWFKGIKTVGITGATSTPQWLMERVKTKIEDMEEEKQSVSQPKIIHEFITH
jgi:4-hydroxy-3-methylbut-2-enyl diphosphate reductase